MIPFYSLDLEALKVVRMLWKNPIDGQRMMKLYEQQIGLFEIFLEAVPTVFVMTILLLKTELFYIMLYHQPDTENNSMYSILCSYYIDLMFLSFNNHYTFTNIKYLQVI